MYVILLQKIINQKLNSLDADGLLQLAKQNGLSIDRVQAQAIVRIIRGKNINIFNEAERISLLKKVAAITSPETAQQVNQLLKQFIG
jgi:ribosomal protein L12E/L44/L45/RPP1/RPP2